MADERPSTSAGMAINGASNSSPNNAAADPAATNNNKKNRPKATRLRQQKLPAWQPILTASTVIPAIFGIGIVFLPIGIALYLASESVKEFGASYTNCKANNVHGSLSLTASQALNMPEYMAGGVLCEMGIILEEDFDDDVYFYYGLDNFYQNHRRYVKSRSDSQLFGSLGTTGDCDPYQYEQQNNSSSKKIAPCGAVANSMFNDTFRLYLSRNPEVEVPFTTDGVIWSVDREKKFKNPSGDNLCDAFKGYAKPPNWQNETCKTGDAKRGWAFENVDFIVWMRTAALPNFRKLYRRLDRSATPTFAKGLPAGNYSLRIAYNYPVTKFNGEKRFIISTTSWAGAKNSFLGIAYMVVGVFCIVLGIVFLGIHIKFGNSLTEISNVRPGTS